VQVASHHTSLEQESSMTVNKTNRSHRTAYMVVMLALAVALTTALVLAGESQKKNVFQQNLHKTFSVELQKGAGRCVAA
jgi:uncharacterized protein HemX